MRFLLELLTEEIPAQALPSARRQLVSGFREGFERAELPFKAIKAYSTSRRLALVVDGLPEKQNDRVEEIVGPPERVAFGEDGEPTKAALGFARKVGVDVGELQVVETEKGRYVAARIHVAGRPTTEILKELVLSVVPRMSFPKTMRWGSGEYVFVRPLHRLIALLDHEVIDLELFGVRSGRVTLGHRVHHREDVVIQDAYSYEDAMRRASVVVDPEERAQALKARSAELAASLELVPRKDPELVEEHVELVEYPGMVLGSFDRSYLDLPPEVVITTLRHHQKCLILEDGRGNLAPYFLAVTDRKDDPKGLVKQGNEWVIGARLEDARFFFNEDRKRKLEELVPQLDSISFHRKLGSMLEKARRVALIAEWLREREEPELASSTVERAAMLARADLASHMVGEFPELQGIMGGHYLRLEGEPEELWKAVRDHYLPASLDGKVPETATGRIVAAADRLDTLVSLFAAGEKPTGSRDPYGLRRAAQGAVAIWVAGEWSTSLVDAVERAYSVLGWEKDSLPAVLSFLKERVRRYLEDVVGGRHDSADAVVATWWATPPMAVKAVKALEAVRDGEEFRKLAQAAKRIRNMLKSAGDVAGVREELVSEPAEAGLLDSASRLQEELDVLLEDGRFQEAFSAAAAIADPLDQFFGQVLVMDPDPNKRANRLALLAKAGSQLSRLADFSRLQLEGGE